MNMIGFLRKTITLSLVGLGLLMVGGFVALPATVFADASQDQAETNVCEGIGGTRDADGNCDTGGPELQNILEIIINVLSVLVGLAAVIMIIVGGFKYVTANGDTANVKSAQHTIMYAVIGIIIVAFAQFIVQFVLDRATTAPKDEETTSANTIVIEPHRRNVI